MTAKPKRSPEPTSDLLTVAQAAGIAQTSRKTIYAAIKKGGLPAARDARGCLMIKRSDVEAWGKRPYRAGHRNSAVSLQCAWCGAEVSRWPSQIASDEGLVFCSKEHSLEFAHMRRRGGIETPFETALAGHRPAAQHIVSKTVC